MRIVLALLLLSVMILFHELGHFFLAKTGGIVVTEFSLGMGPRLLSFVRGGTRYSLKLLPFGGSCAMLGEDEDSDQEGSFQAASVWRRIAVVAAGPVFNLFMALVCAAVIIFTSGAVPALVSEVREGSPAVRAGLMEGDRIVRFNGNGIANGNELYLDLLLDGTPTDEVRLTVIREGKREKISYRPEIEESYMMGFSYTPDENPALISALSDDGALKEAGAAMADVITRIDGTSIPSGRALAEYFTDHPMTGEVIRVGLERGSQELELEVRPRVRKTADLGFAYNMQRRAVSPVSALGYAFGELSYNVHLTWKSLSGLVTGRFSVREMSGPVGIVKTVGDAYEEAAPMGAAIVLLTLLNIIVLISVNLAFVNLLPLPALDGGRLVFLLLEVIRRKRISQELEGRVHFAGILILLAFSLFVTFQDLVKIF